jgi:hypothetical protein
LHLQRQPERFHSTALFQPLPLVTAAPKATTGTQTKLTAVLRCRSKYIRSVVTAEWVADSLRQGYNNPRDNLYGPDSNTMAQRSVTAWL